MGYYIIIIKDGEAEPTAAIPADFLFSSNVYVLIIGIYRHMYQNNPKLLKIRNHDFFLETFEF